VHCKIFSVKIKIKFFLILNSIQVVTVVTFVRLKKIEVGDYIFPDWTLILGELMTASVLLGIIGWAVYAIFDSIFINKRVFLFLILFVKNVGLNIFY
jgi:hypothetical protein